MNQLEVLHFSPKSPRLAPPLLFLHGAYVGAWCWEPFLAASAAAGFDAYALSFRGHAESPGGDMLDVFGIDDYMADLESVVDSMPKPPVLIAHSMGGFVAQRYLSRGGKAAALALMASVPPYGLTGSMLHMGLFYPKLLMGLNQFEFGAMPRPDLHLLRELLFSAEISEALLAQFALRAQRESTHALMEMMMPQPWRLWALPSIPALVLGAEEDKVIPEADTLALARALGVEPEFIAGVGHALMLDAGQDRVLARLLAWLETRPWGG